MRRRDFITLLGGVAAAWPNPASAKAATDEAVEQLVRREVGELLPPNNAGGVAVAIRLGGRTLFFNYGYADVANKQPVTPDSLFNLGSVAKTFEALLLAQAVRQGELSFEDFVVNHVVELQKGADIKRVTLGQLASFSSGLLLPQDRPPWPEETFTLNQYLATLNAWRLAAGRQPGQQVIHASSGYILLRLALERRFAKPYGELMQLRILGPLGMSSTTLPVAAVDVRSYPRGQLPRALADRAVQGYDKDGKPVGERGDLQGYYHWFGTGQMYSSARDMAVFLAANLGELPGHRLLQEAMQVTQHGIIRIDERRLGAMAWERHVGRWEIVDRYGGLNNASATIAIVPAAKLGIVVLCNRGGQGGGTGAAGRAILNGLTDR